MLFIALIRDSLHRSLRLPFFFLFLLLLLAKLIESFPIVSWQAATAAASMMVLILDVVFASGWHGCARATRVPGRLAREWR